MIINIQAGWVNIKWLNKGNERVRPLPIDTGNSIVAPPTTLPGTPSCLEKTVNGLWKAIHANRTTIEAELPLSPEISSRLFGPNTSHYPNEIMRGAKSKPLTFLSNHDSTDKLYDTAFTPAARELMASGDFHPRHFSRLQALSKTAPFPEKPGIYVRVYPGIESPDFLIFRHRQKPPSTGLYSGQTIGSQWPTRFSDHEKGMAGSKAQHYRLARTCDTENVAMIPIILFDENQPMVRVLTLASCLSAAELTMVCLFKSWFPLLLGPTPLNAVAAYIVDFRSAKVFANIIDVVKSRTGWNPNEIVGCNWQTPVIRDIDMELTWCSWFDYEKDMKVFRCRRRLFVRLKKNGTPEDAWVRVAQNENLFLPVEVLNQANLVSGQAIHVVVEFMANGMDHPSMWVRFPRIGPNPELEILRSMAIRIEWTDASGQWFTCALTRSKIWTYINNDSTKIPTIYQLGMTLAKILQCINYTGAPEWMPTSIGRVVVKEFNYQHLKQQLIAVNAQSRQKQWPADYTVQQNATRLQTLVNSKGWPTSVGIRPDGMHKGRQACDICVSQASVSTILIDILH